MEVPSQHEPQCFCSDCHTKEGDGMRPDRTVQFSLNLRNPFTEQYGTRGGGDLQKQPIGELCFDCHDQNEYWDSTTNGKAMVGTGFYQNGTNGKSSHTACLESMEFGEQPLALPMRELPFPRTHGYYRKALIVLDTDAQATMWSYRGK